MGFQCYYLVTSDFIHLLRQIKFLRLKSNWHIPQKKGNPQFKLLFLKTSKICQKRFTLLQNSVYPLSFECTSYKMY